MPRWALVTGAAGDLGRAIGAALAADGWSLQLTDHPSQAGRLEATHDACRDSGVEVAVATFDVTDQGSVATVLASLASEYGTPTAVIANAGVQGDFAPVHEYAVADLRQVLEVNVVGVFTVVSASAKVMIAADTGGSIVVTASMAGVSGAPNMPAYSASKAAAIGLVKSAAKDLAQYRIRVNAVSPAFIGPGAMWDNQVARQAAAGSQYYAADPEEVARQMIEMIPLRRFGAPSEVADVVCFLAGDRSSYLTGLNLEITGGSV